MIFVAEIMNTLPFSDSLALSIPSPRGGEGDRLRLKNGRVGKGFVVAPVPLWISLSSLPDLITGDVHAIPVIIAIRGTKI